MCCSSALYLFQSAVSAAILYLLLLLSQSAVSAAAAAMLCVLLLSLNLFHPAVFTLFSMCAAASVFAALSLKLAIFKLFQCLLNKNQYFMFSSCISFVSKSVSAESVLRYFCRGIFIPVLAPIPQLSGSSQSVTISGLSPPYLPPLGQL